MAILTARVQRFFLLFILSTTSEKLFIPYKASTAVQALKVCPVRPRVLSRRFFQFGQESCPAGEYLQQKNKKINIENNCDILCLFVVIM